MFSTSWCGYCRQARNLLYGLRVPFVEWDIERSPAARQEFERRFGRGAGVPILDIGGTVVRGYNEPAIRRAVDRLRTPQKQNPRPATPQP